MWSFPLVGSVSHPARSLAGPLHQVPAAGAAFGAPGGALGTGELDPRAGGATHGQQAAAFFDRRGTAVAADQPECPLVGDRGSPDPEEGGEGPDDSAQEAASADPGRHRTGTDRGLANRVRAVSDIGGWGWGWCTHGAPHWHRICVG